MNWLPFRIARRYLFTKKSTNAINVITGISMFGIAVGTAALVLVLSVFNGFEDLLAGMFNKFNPEIKVTPASGKTFETDSVLLSKVRAMPGVAYVSETLEEISFFDYKENQDFGTLKGVDEHFHQVVGIDSAMLEGAFQLQENDRSLAVLGTGIRNKLDIGIENILGGINVYAPKRRQGGPLDQPFRRRSLYPAGVFAIQQDYDFQYVITNIDFIRDLLEVGDVVSAWEIKSKPGFDLRKVGREVQNLLGDQYVVKDRFQQEEAFLKLMQMEKWLGFAVVSLMIVLVAFNVVGVLWMIVLEKQEDIAILKSMGMNERMVRSIVLNQGGLITGIGMVSGFFLAILLYVLQKNFNLVPIGAGFVIDSYPLAIRGFDFIIVSIVVLAIGLLASFPPARRAERIPALVREA